jgi:hypothetical protein
MTELALIDVVGHWLGIFLTFCILSFLYKDNPFYKVAEHLFIGVSIGYVVTQQYYNVLRPKLIDRIADADHWYFNWDLFALVLVALMFVKAVSRRWSWVGRYPLAFVVAFYAGIQINAVAQADLGAQIKRSVASVDAHKLNVNTATESDLIGLPGISPSIARQIVAQQPLSSLDDIAAIPTLSDAERALVASGRGPIQGLDARVGVADGGRYWFGILSNILLLLGLLASLVYFYFSVAHRGPIGKISRFGVWVLMIGFGASFGYTVQGRLSLAIGRALDVLDMNKGDAVAAQIRGPIVALVSIVIIVGGIVLWELSSRRAPGGPGGGAAAGSRPGAGDDSGSTAAQGLPS